LGLCEGSCASGWSSSGPGAGFPLQIFCSGGRFFCIAMTPRSSVLAFVSRVLDALLVGVHGALCTVAGATL
jgi:hypothetical protein